MNSRKICHALVFKPFRLPLLLATESSLPRTKELSPVPVFTVIGMPLLQLTMLIESLPFPGVISMAFTPVLYFARRAYRTTLKR